MKNKIILLILGMFLITFISAYYVEISTNPGEMEFEGDTYHGSIILKTPSNTLTSDTYTTNIGFLYDQISEAEHGGGLIKEKGFFERNKYFCFCIFLVLILILLLIIFGKREKEEK